MKKEEKTRRTYEKILHAAIVEFGTKSYENASLNTICSENNISKGLLYHNFKGKDDLYLQCVKKCFQELYDYLRNTPYEGATTQESLHNLLHLRQKYFRENPYSCSIFFHAILQPPAHLRPELHKLSQESHSFYADCFRRLLGQLHLRDSITVDMAAEYLILFQEMFNGYFQNKPREEDDFHSLIEDHEGNLSKILDIILYGLVERPTP